jgi:hypothetical protein
MSKKADPVALGVANVVPLTTSKQPDPLIFPIARAYSQLAPGFTPDGDSCAVVNFYQPIETRYFCQYRGTIDENTVVAIKTILQLEVLGLAEFDFGP